MITKNNSIPKFVRDPCPEIYLSDNYGVLDFETTNFDGDPTPRNPRNRILCWSFKSRNGLRYGDGSKRSLGILRECVDCAHYLVAHSSKFEQQWLKAEGILDYGSKLWYDTLLAEYVLAGNRRRKFGLDETLERYGISGKHRFIHSCLANDCSSDDLPPSWFGEYNVNDTKRTEELFLSQRQILKDSGLLPVLYTRCLVPPVLLDIESRGISLDPERTLAAYAEFNERLVQLTAECKEHLGDILLSSPKQVAEALYDGLGIDELRDYKGQVIKTKGGGRSASRPTIERLVGKTRGQREALKALVQRSRVETALEFLTKFKRVLDSGSRTFYGQLQQGVTANHRLSGKGISPYDIQPQNIPREFKYLFNCRLPEEQTFTEIDLVQFEFRVAINFSKDPQGIQDVESGFDVHRFSSGHLGISRQFAKPHTFKPVFGGTSGTPTERKYYKAFNERYSVLYSRQKEWVTEVLKTGKYVTPWGLIFYWPNAKPTKSGFVTYSNEIFNYPISAFACGEVAQIGLVYMWYLLRSSEARSYLTNTIHDSISGDIFNDEVKLFRELAVKAFGDYTLRYIRDVYKVDWILPLGIEIKEGAHWGEGTEEKIELPPLS